MISALFFTSQARKRVALLLSGLLLSAASLTAQDTCPRVWRDKDTLWTDPAERYQWHKNDTPIPDATQRFFVPTDPQAASYSVEVFATSAVYNERGEQPDGLVFVALDHRYRPVAGARVRYGAIEGYTDAEGRFAISYPQATGRQLVRVDHPDYLPQAQGFLLAGAPGQTVHVPLARPSSSLVFDAAKGGAFTRPGVRVFIPENALVDEGGNAYTGQASVRMTSARPGDIDFGQRMPGRDFTTDDGGQLLSFGFVTVELRDEEGNRLNLAPGRPARVQIQARGEDPLPTVPFWHFDEEAAVWKSEGEATLIHGWYTAEAPHFSSWNVDIRFNAAEVTGRVLDCKGRLLRDAQVQAAGRVFYTNSEGRFRFRVPADWAFGLNAAGSPDTLTVGPLAVDEVFDAGDLTGSKLSGYGVVDNGAMLRVLVQANAGAYDSFRYGSLTEWVTADSVQLPNTGFPFSSVYPLTVTLRDTAGCEAQMPVLIEGRVVDCMIPEVNEIPRSTEKGDLTRIVHILQATGPVHSFSTSPKPVGSIPSDYVWTIPECKLLAAAAPCAVKMQIGSTLLHELTLPQNLRHLTLQPAQNIRFAQQAGPLDLLRTLVIQRIPSLGPHFTMNDELLKFPNLENLTYSVITEAPTNPEKRVDLRISLTTPMPSIRQLSLNIVHQPGVYDQTGCTFRIEDSIAILAGTLEKLNIDGISPDRRRYPEQADAFLAEIDALRARLQTLLPNTEITIRVY